VEVKHQVFVSSTQKDLIEERKAVTHALLELDCIPAGMELFPATDEDAWTLIKEVIDGCDYYLLIIAGKYGSVGHDGVGYTEMEFDYAASVGKPIIAFLHESPDSILAVNSEKTESLQESLRLFREKAKKKHCKFWSNSEDLGGKVSRSIVQLRKKHPSPGWVPGRYAASEAMLREIQELRSRVAELELDAVIGSGSPPAGTHDLAQGSDTVTLTPSVRYEKNGEETKIRLKASWDLLFSYVGASMGNECTDEEMMGKVALAFWHAVPKEIRGFNSLDELVIPYVTEDKVRVQLQALGLIAPGIKRRAVSDKGRYWRLTPYGEKYLLSIRAVKRKNITPA
jgi:hypothetical protein